MSGNKKHPLVPQLRFTEFRDAGEWLCPSLGEISKPVEERVGDRQLTPVSISAGIGFVPQAEKFGRDISGNQYKLYTVVRDGDFVYNKGNSLRFPQGCVYDLQGWGEVAAPNVFICFRLNNGYENSFYRQCFEMNAHGAQLRKHITSGARSNGLLNISKDAFWGVRIPTPEPAEQQKIADCLSSLGELISAETYKLNVLRNYKRGLIQQLFPKEGKSLPLLRFPEFSHSKSWKKEVISNLLEKVVNPVNVDVNKIYREIGIRSHGKGVFHKAPILGAALGNKRVFWVEENVFMVNIVFAWEQAVAVTSSAENGMIASHRFPMYRPKQKIDIRLLKYLFLTAKGKELLGIASPGGAGRNKTLGQKEFEKLELLIPEDIQEQTAIADVISTFDNLLEIQGHKIDALKAHKRGLMQQLFPVLDEVYA